MELNRHEILLQEQRKIRAELVRLSRLSPLELSQERNANCPHCGTLLLPRKETFTVFGKQRVQWVWPSRCGCEGEARALLEAERDAERSAQERVQTEYAATLWRAGLSERTLAGYTFDTYDDRPDWPDAAGVRARALRYANAVIGSEGMVIGKPWLVMYGDYGLGKSHLAGAIIRRAIDYGLRDCYFRVWPRYLARIQATWNRRNGDDDYGAESEAEIVDELTRGRLVAIDDLDKREFSKPDAGAWTRSILFDVVNTRYNTASPTVLTFNRRLDDRALLDYIGAAVLDRIVQQAYDVIEFRGPSYRMAGVGK